MSRLEGFLCILTVCASHCKPVPYRQAPSRNNADSLLPHLALPWVSSSHWREGLTHLPERRPRHIHSEPSLSTCTWPLLYVPLLPLKVLVPRSVANGSVYPAMGVQYGHGLFGDQVENFSLLFLSFLLFSLFLPPPSLPVSLLPLLPRFSPTEWGRNRLPSRAGRQV